MFLFTAIDNWLLFRQIGPGGRTRLDYSTVTVALDLAPRHDSVGLQHRAVACTTHVKRFARQDGLEENFQ